MYKEYFPKHSENRMKNEGNVIAAREYFLTGKNRILYNLVKKRFSWMNKYIRGGGQPYIGIGLRCRIVETFYR